MFNIISTLSGEQEGKELIFCGHTDVVPAGDLSKWDWNPNSGEVKDGWMLGRGASDMKAGLGGLLFAYTALKRLGISSLVSSHWPLFPMKKQGVNTVFHGFLKMGTYKEMVV